MPGVPSDAERARSLLAYANYAKVAAALLVSRAAVADWAKGKSVTPYRLRQLEQLLRPDLQTHENAAPLEEERLGRIERLVTAIAAATPGVVLEEVEAVIQRVDEIERSRPQPDESHQTGGPGIRGGSAG